jgi:hypothetical protein
MPSAFRDYILPLLGDANFRTLLLHLDQQHRDKFVIAHTGDPAWLAGACNRGARRTLQPTRRFPKRLHSPYN